MGSSLGSFNDAHMSADMSPCIMSLGSWTSAHSAAYDPALHDPSC